MLVSEGQEQMHKSELKQTEFSDFVCAALFKLFTLICRGIWNKIKKLKMDTDLWSLEQWQIYYAISNQIYYDFILFLIQTVFDCFSSVPCSQLFTNQMLWGIALTSVKIFHFAISYLNPSEQNSLNFSNLLLSAILPRLQKLPDFYCLLVP